jgi:hypothetical protein
VPAYDDEHGLLHPGETRALDSRCFSTSMERLADEMSPLGDIGQMREAKSESAGWSPDHGPWDNGHHWLVASCHAKGQRRDRVIDPVVDVHG